MKEHVTFQKTSESAEIKEKNNKNNINCFNKLLEFDFPKVYVALEER